MLEHEEMWPLNFTNITGHIEPILEQNYYCDDNVLNLKRHSGNMSFVRPLDLLYYGSPVISDSKKGSELSTMEQ